MKKDIKLKLNTMSHTALRLVLSDCLGLNAGSSHDKRVLKAITNYIRSRTVCSTRVVLHDTDIVQVCEFWRSIAVCDSDWYDRDLFRLK